MHVAFDCVNKVQVVDCLVRTLGRSNNLLTIDLLIKTWFYAVVCKFTTLIYPLKCEALALALKTSGLGLGLVLAGLDLGLEDLWPWPWPCIAWPWLWPWP